MSLSNRILFYTAGTFVAAGFAITNVLSHTNNTLEFIAFVLRSKLSLLALLNFAYCLLFLFGKLLQHIFFGPLRENEAQNMSERALTFVLTKLVFVLAILEPDLRELLIWTSWFSLVGFFKLFSMLSRDRFAHVVTIMNIPNTVHYKILFFLGLILVMDLCWLWFCVAYFGEAGASVLFLLTFECFILLLEVVQTIIKYCVHLYDVSLPQTWEFRGAYIYYTEFITDSLSLMTTLAHYVHILYIHGLSFTLIDALLLLHMRLVYLNLRQKVNAYRVYRTVAYNLQSQYPDVSAEELASKDEICPICRDQMTTAKKLPCNHMFHFGCLRTWLENHDSCPTCRMSLIDNRYPQVENRQATADQTAPLQQPVGLGVGVGVAQRSILQWGAPILSWLPNFVNVDVMRHNDVVRLDEPAFHPSQQDIQLLHEMFPHIPADIIAADLARSGSVQLTSENIMEGRLDALAQQAPQPPAPSQQQQQQQPPSADPVSSAPDSASPSTTTTTTALTPTGELIDRRASFSSDILTLPPNQFASTSEERETSLLRRRQQMVELQRKAYLARKNAASASPSPDSSVQSSSSPSPVSSLVDQPSTPPHPTPTPTPSEDPASSSSLSIPSASPSPSPSPAPAASTEAEGETTTAVAPSVSDREEVRRILAERAERISRQRFGAQQQQ